MKQLEDAIAKIRAEQPAEESLKAAAGRVFSKLFDSAFIAADPAGKIRTCADVRALIPAYIGKTVSASRALLLEDHVLNCVDCRRALQEARHGEAAPRAIPVARAPRKGVPMLAWAVAATLLLGIGLGLTGLLPGQNTVRATVASVQGSLYKITDLGVALVEAGAILKNTDELRTAKGSHAILRLAGGAMVEIAERSDVAVSGGWRGTTLTLERGQMIVDARAGQKSLNVNSGEMTVPVGKGVVAFNRGSKESRVAVANGFADVRMGAASHRVAAGQLYGGELRLANVSVSNEFAWSENAASYSALLDQLSGLQKDIQAIPEPDLRYSSNLLEHIPADTYLYAAVPNLGGTITEAKKLFDTRLKESEALRQWWSRHPVSQNGKFDRIVEEIGSISAYLGNEIVVTANGAGVVFLAEIKKPGLEEYLQTHLPAGAAKELRLQMDGGILTASAGAGMGIRPAAASQAALKARIAKIYTSGAGYFLVADLEQIAAKSVTNASGLENVQYLVLERKQIAGDTEMKASLSFDGARHGVASWLGAPSPAGSLDFISPEAGFAASLVMKNPSVMMRELLGMANFGKDLDDFQAKAGVNLLDDVAAPLGSDVTLALDGPLLPIPAWKIVMEVYDPVRLQNTLRLLADRYNRDAPAKSGRMLLTREEVGGRTFYSLSAEKAPGLGAFYTFVDGYLVASSSQANVLAAIQNKQTGRVLAQAPDFRAKLPADGYPNYSAMIYTHLDSQLADLAKSAKSQTFAALLAKGGSGLVCVYGEPDRIVATAKGSFLGFDLGTLVGVQQGQPLRNMIAGAPPMEKGGRGVSN